MYFVHPIFIVLVRMVNPDLVSSSWVKTDYLLLSFKRFVFTYSGHESFVKSVVCKCFLPFYILSFYSLNGVFCKENVFNLVFNVVYPRALFLTSGHKFSPMIWYLLSYCFFYSISIVCVGKTYSLLLNYEISISNQTSILGYLLGDFDSPVIILSLHWMSILLKEKQFR